MCHVPLVSIMSFTSMHFSRANRRTLVSLAAMPMQSNLDYRTTLGANESALKLKRNSRWLIWYHR